MTTKNPTDMTPATNLAAKRGMLIMAVTRALNEEAEAREMSATLSTMTHDDRAQAAEAFAKSINEEFGNYLDTHDPFPIGAIVLTPEDYAGALERLLVELIHLNAATIALLTEHHIANAIAFNEFADPLVNDYDGVRKDDIAYLNGVRKDAMKAWAYSPTVSAEFLEFVEARRGMNPEDAIGELIGKILGAMNAPGYTDDDDDDEFAPIDVFDFAANGKN